MALEVIVNRRRGQNGGMKYENLTFVTTATANDVQTGLRRIRWASVQQQTGTADNNVRVNINSNTTSDNNGNPGMVHFAGAASGSIYELYVEGY